MIMPLRNMFLIRFVYKLVFIRGDVQADKVD